MNREHTTQVSKLVTVAGNGFDARTDYPVVMMSLSSTSSPDVGTGVPACGGLRRAVRFPHCGPAPFPLRWGRAAISPNTRSRSGVHRLRRRPVQRAPGSPFADWLSAFAVRSDSISWLVMFSKYSFE